MRKSEGTEKLLYKSIFITISVIIMICASKLIADVLGLEQHFTATMLVGGSLWAWIASVVFDSYEKRKRRIIYSNSLMKHCVI
ncbi:hypothetical protein LOS22_14720 [Enterococcus faecium]|nr:hypothetical protein [Enterococcus faecium]